MSSDERQRGVLNRLGSRARLRPGRVGEPNVLSGAAVPNRLSDQAEPPKRVQVSASGGAAPAPVSVPRRSAPPVQASMALPADLDAPQAGRRLPALPTIIFLGFAVLTAVRLFGEFSESAAPSGPTQSAPAASARPPATVEFGTSVNDDCELTGAQTAFAQGTEVWWVARLSTRQGPSAVVVARVLRDGDVLTRDVWPADGSAAWSLMCDGPISEDAAGTYRLEVWNEGETVLYAAGEYVIR